jgi:3D (Asp-Asp-Asp) domain-containing protein
MPYQKFPLSQTSLCLQIPDHGAAIHDGRLNVFFNFYQQTLNWGVKYLDIKANLK